MAKQRVVKTSKHGTSLLTWRQRKRLRASSNSAKGQPKSYWIVGCDVHGFKPMKEHAKIIRVAAPRFKRDVGCPYCRSTQVDAAQGVRRLANPS